MARIARTAAAMIGSVEAQARGSRRALKRLSAIRSRRSGSNFIAPSAQALHEMRTERVGDPHRQALPQCNEGPVLRVERIVLRDARAPIEAVLIGERRGLETPVPLEVVGAGSLLAAAEVEDADAALARAAHQLPVLEVVRREIARLGAVTGVVRGHFVLEIEAQYRRQRFTSGRDDGHDLGVRAEGRAQGLEVALR